MRWRHPVDNETTPWKRKFAWLPVTIAIREAPHSRLNSNGLHFNTNYYTIWFEHYEQRKIYRLRYRPTKFGTIKGWGWDTEVRICEDNQNG